MTNNITISQYHTGFINVSDRLFVGDDREADTSIVGVFTLPEGYFLDKDTNYIHDPEGYRCHITMHSSGRPQLISMAGPHKASPVLDKAGMQPSAASRAL